MSKNSIIIYFFISLCLILHVAHASVVHEAAEFSFQGKRCTYVRDNTAGNPLCAFIRSTNTSAYDPTKNQLDLRCPFSDMTIANVKRASWTRYIATNQPNLSGGECMTGIPYHYIYTNNTCFADDYEVEKYVAKRCEGNRVCHIPTDASFWKTKRSKISIADCGNGNEVYLQVKYTCERSTDSECMVYDTMCKHDNRSYTAGNLQWTGPWPQVDEFARTGSACNGPLLQGKLPNGYDFGPDGRCVVVNKKTPRVFNTINGSSLHNVAFTITYVVKVNGTVHFKVDGLLLAVLTAPRVYANEGDVMTITTDPVILSTNETHIVAFEIEYPSSQTSFAIRSIRLIAGDCVLSNPIGHISLAVTPARMYSFIDNDCASSLGQDFDIGFGGLGICSNTNYNSGNVNPWEPFYNGDTSNITAELICPYPNMVITNITFGRYSRINSGAPNAVTGAVCAISGAETTPACIIGGNIVVPVLKNLCLGKNKCVVPINAFWWKVFFPSLTSCNTAGTYLKANYTCAATNTNRCYIYDTFCNGFNGTNTGGLIKWQTSWKTNVTTSQSIATHFTAICQGNMNPDSECVILNSTAIGTTVSMTNYFCAGPLTGITYSYSIAFNQAAAYNLSLYIDGVRVSGSYDTSSVYAREYSNTVVTTDMPSNYTIPRGNHSVMFTFACAARGCLVYFKDFSIRTNTSNELCNQTMCINDPSQSESQSQSMSPSQSLERTKSQTQSLVNTQSQTQSLENTKSQTQSHSRSNSQTTSNTMSNTESISHSESQTTSNTVSNTQSSSHSDSQTTSNTMSNTESISHSESQTTSNTMSAKETASRSNSQTTSNTMSNSQSMSNSNSQTTSNSMSISQSMSNSNSHTMSSTMSNTESASHSNSQTTSNTMSNTESISHSDSQTTSNTMSNTESASHSNSQTTSNTMSAKETASRSNSQSMSNSDSQTTSNTMSNTQSMSDSNSQTTSNTMSNTESASHSNSQTTSNTMSNTESISHSDSQTTSNTMSAKESASHSNSQTTSNTMSNTESISHSDSQTKDNTMSSTRSMSNSGTQSESNSNSNTLSMSESVSNSDSHSRSKTPIHHSRSPIHPSRSPIHPSRSPVHPSRSPIHHSISPIHPSRSPIHPSMSPQKSSSESYPPPITDSPAIVNSESHSTVETNPMSLSESPNLETPSMSDSATIASAESESINITKGGSGVASDIAIVMGHNIGYVLIVIAVAVIVFFTILINAGPGSGTYYITKAKNR